MVATATSTSVSGRRIGPALMLSTRSEPSVRVNAPFTDDALPITERPRQRRKMVPSTSPLGRCMRWG